MQRNVERYCELANKTTQQLYKVSTPCIDDHHFREEEMKSFGEMSQVCSQIVLKCLYLARIGRPDILWSVDKLARSTTKWTKACDKRLNRLISFVHHTCEWLGGWGSRGSQQAAADSRGSRRCVVPSSRRGNTSSESRRRKSRAAHKG